MSKFWSKIVHQLTPYVPGEQPKINNLVKLNTNENPYPPSPKVLAAVKAAVDGRLRLYPNPTASALRERLAKLHGCAPENLIVGNGSDELLALATRTFVEPSSGTKTSGSTVQFFSPSYSLYPVLVAIQDGACETIEFDRSMRLPVDRIAATKAGIFFLTSPNAPTGVAFRNADLERVLAGGRDLALVLLPLLNDLRAVRGSALLSEGTLLLLNLKSDREAQRSEGAGHADAPLA